MRALFSAIFAVWALGAGSSAVAQLILPGAATSAPSSVAPPSGAPIAGPNGSLPGAPVAKKPSIHAPGVEAVAGRDLLLNGSNGVMSIEKSGAGLQIRRIAFAGYQISRPTQACKVEVDGSSIQLSPAARHEGLLSFDAPLEACPFSLDILDGATLVRGKTCDFVAADCRVDPDGLWGPPPSAISPAEDKTIESLRATGEAEARDSFRELLAAHKRDKARVKAIAHDQAGFSSIREETCRGYAGEDKHAFCASRLTLAHAVALATQLRGDGEGDPADAPKKPRKPKPKPVAPPPPPAGAFIQ